MSSTGYPAEPVRYEDEPSPRVMALSPLETNKVDTLDFCRTAPATPPKFRLLP